MSENENKTENNGGIIAGPCFTSDSSIDEPTEEDCRKTARKERILVIVCIISIIVNVCTTFFVSRSILYPGLALSIAWIAGDRLCDDPRMEEKYIAIYIATIIFCLLDCVAGNLLRAHYGF